MLHSIYVKRLGKHIYVVYWPLTDPSSSRNSSRGLTAGRTTRMWRLYEIIYTQVPMVSHSQVEEIQAVKRFGEQLANTWSGVTGSPSRTLVADLSSKRQGHKALNMESQCELRRGQYNSSLPVNVCILHLSLSLSHTFTANFRPFK